MNVAKKEYEQYERDCERIRDENEELLHEFGVWLMEKGLSEATIRRHLSNIDLYVNYFLLEEQATPAAEGYAAAGSYLDFWFIRKVSASEWAIRSNAASLRKFYGFLVDRTLAEPDDLAELNEEIKHALPTAAARAQRYNDPAITDPEEVWGL